jgi:hypothetical protein
LNLVSLFDGGASTTRRFSRLGADIPTFPGDEEGFVFLGLGVLSCVLICSIGRLSAGVRDRTMIPALPAAGIVSTATMGIVYLLGSGGVTSVLWGLFAGVLTVNVVPHMRESANRRRVSDWLPLAVTLLALALFAMSHSVAIGEYRLPSISMSDYVSAGLGTLRATGRFAWPGYYMLMLACFWFAGRMARGRLILATTVLCLTFQTVDLWPAIMRLNERFSRPTSWVSVLKDPRWEEFASRYRAVRVFPLENLSTDWIQVSDFAALHGMGSGYVRLARVNPRGWATAQSIMNEIVAGRFDPAALYIVRLEGADVWENLRATNANVAFIGAIDDFLLIAP